MRAADPEISSKMSASPLERITPSLGALTRLDAALPRGGTLASPSLVLGEYLTHEWHREEWTHSDFVKTWGSWQGFATHEIPIWVASITSFLVTYGFGLALVMGFAFYQRLRDSQLRSAALER